MSTTHCDTVNLLGLPPLRLTEFLAYIGEDTAQTGPLLNRIHQQGTTDFNPAEGLSPSLTEKLSLVAKVEPPKIRTTQKSEDGTWKWLIEVTGGSCIETIYMPQLDGGTLCLSSQAGCALNCSFCGTGRLGFDRNLRCDEIIGQLWLARSQLVQQVGTHGHKITKVVFMGMGEPLLNFNNVMATIALLTSKNAYGFHSEDITLSTSGLVPAINKLASYTRARLAISLHAPNDALRNQLVTINRKYSIQKLLRAATNYLEQLPAERREMLVQYILIDQINDQAEHAEQLAQLLTDLPVYLELIPLNKISNSAYQPPSVEQVNAFAQRLRNSGYRVAIRPALGADIEASCGQLAGRVQDRTRRSTKYR